MPDFFGVEVGAAAHSLRDMRNAVYPGSCNAG